MVALALSLAGPEGIPPAAALPTGPGVTYAHDAAGRVTAAFDPAGNGARIGYDAVGNIAGITRLRASTLAVAQVSPPAASVGTAIDVFVTRLGTDPAAVTVAFAGGVVARPSAIAGNKAVVTVPAGAATGTVTVTAGGQSASWPAFTVVSRPAPTITNLTTVQLANVGGMVPVTGTGFQATVSDNRVDLGGTKVPVRSATSTSLALGMPAVRPFGRVRVSTPDGVATSASYVVVPPAPYLAADVSSAVPVTVTTPGQMSVAAQHIGLAMFEVPAGERASVRLTPGPGVGSYASSVWGAEFRSVGSEEFTFGVRTYTLEPRPAPTTYLVEVDPQASGSGSVDVRLQTGTDRVATVTVDGPPVQLQTAVAYTNALFRFRGRAGQRVRARITNLTTSPSSAGADAWLLSPTGARLTTRTALRGTDVLNGTPLSVTGQYTVMLATRNEGSLTVTVAVETAAANPAATAVIDGAAGSVAFTAVGQVGRVTFTGAVDQRVWIRFHTTFALPFSPGIYYSLAGPDGTELRPEQVSTGDDDTFAQVITLPLTGIYTVVVDPIALETGSSTVAVTTVPAQPAEIAAAVDGQPYSATVAYGQDAVARFSNAVSRRVSITIDSAWTVLSCDTNWTLTTAAGTVVTSSVCSRYMDALPLPVGDYRLTVDLNGRNSGALTVRLFAVPADATTTAMVGGAEVPVATTTPGRTRRSPSPRPPASGSTSAAGTRSPARTARSGTGCSTRAARRWSTGTTPVRRSR